MDCNFSKCRSVDLVKTSVYLIKEKKYPAACNHIDSKSLNGLKVIKWKCSKGCQTNRKSLSVGRV